MNTMIQIPVSSKYINFGVENNFGDMTFIQVNFFSNIYNWGIVVVNPNGETDTITVDYEQIAEMEIIFENKTYGIEVIPPHDGMYEVIFKG